MDQSNKSSKIAAGVAVVLMLAAFTWGAWNARQIGNLESARDQEKLKVESLLSEKLLVEKNLASVEALRKDLIDRNVKLERELDEARNLSDLKDGSIKKLQQQLAANKKSYNELTALNQSMEDKLSALNQQLAQMDVERLAANREAETLRGQVDNLKRELAMAHSAYYDNALVESTRGKNDKLVVKASRTKKLKATVMIPSALKDVQFQIFDPSGKLISSSPENGVLAVKINESSSVVANQSSAGSGQTYKQAEMIFLPKKKLAAGTYRVEVLSENLQVGNLQLRLR